MLKLKKKLLPILSFIFVLVACCLTWLSFSSVKAHADAEELKKVELTEFQFFNALSEDSQNVAMGKGKFGMLLRFSDVLSDNITEASGGIKTVNLVDKYGDYVFVNDMPLTFYTDAEICYYFEDYVWVYIPNMDIYRKLSVEAGFQFEDRMIQPLALYMAATVEGYNYWTDDVNAYLTSKTKEVEFKGIEFNNTGYRYFSPQKGLLLEFDQKGENGNWLNKDLSNTLTERDGSWMEINLLNHNVIKNTILGAGASVDENIFLDGTPLKDIPGAVISYHSQRYLWIYVPNMIDYAKFEINDHTLFFDSYLPKVELYSNGNEWVDFDPNASRKDTTGVESVSYDKIEWNNYDFGYRGNKNGLLLKFSDNLSKSTKEIDGSVRNVNKVSANIGEHVSINGKPLKNIVGAEISYHSEQYLWIYIPSVELMAAGGDFAYLTIDKETEFLNAILPEVTLYFDGSYWQEEQPEAENYANNVFADILHNNASVEGDGAYAQTVFSFEDAFTPADNSRPNFAQTGEIGQKIKLNGKTLNELYLADAKTHCLFNEKAYGNNTLSLLFRKADLYPTAEYPITTLTIEDGTKCMNKSFGEKTFYLVDGKWSETSAPSTALGEDMDAPYLYYYGEESYLVFAGEEVMDFSANLFAFDEYEGEVDCTVELPEGATTEGKWNRGEWQVKMLATDMQGNQSEKTITVTAINEEEEYLSIYVNGFFSLRVRYGEKIDKAKSEELLRGDPEKAGTNTSYFVFAGWTFNDKLWDFDTDVVTEDVWLSPTYREYKRLFTLTVKNIDTGVADFLTVKAGDVIDFADYQKEGYTLLIKLDNTFVQRVTVNGDLSVELQYMPIEAEDGAAKAMKSLIACWAGAAFLIVAILVLSKVLGRSKPKKEEEVNETNEEENVSIGAQYALINDNGTTEKLLVWADCWGETPLAMDSNFAQHEKQEKKEGERK